MQNTLATRQILPLGRLRKERRGEASRNAGCNRGPGRRPRDHLDRHTLLLLPPSKRGQLLQEGRRDCNLVLFKNLLFS